MEFADGDTLDADVVVFATGVRPRDELARDCRARGRRARRRRRRRRLPHRPTPRSGPSARSPASTAGCGDWSRPGYAMAEVVVDRLLGGDGDVPGRRPVDQAQAARRRRRELRRRVRRRARRPRGRLRRPGRRRLQEARPVATTRGPCSAASSSATRAPTPRLRPMVGRAARRRPGGLPAARGRRRRGGRRDLPDDAGVCSCNNVTAGTIRCAVTDEGLHRRRRRQGLHPGRHAAAARACRWSRSSSSTELAKPGVDGQHRAVRALRRCRARSCSTSCGSQDLRTFSEIIERHGARPRLRHLQAGRRLDPGQPRHAGHVLEGERATLQDTNDHVMANLQKDGTYSVVPRIPGGEVTPDGLIAIGEVARDFGLYTKITGGQRIDLFGARIEQLPQIWRRLVDAGFESGHAYGKSLRTVKSCVGSTWCRYGVQDSVGPRRRARAALPRPALAAQAQARRLRLRPRVRRGARQGRRRHRHRQGLEPVRRRQRRLHAAARRSCSPRTSTPRPWCAPSTGSSCTTSAPPTGCSAPRRGWRRSRAASTHVRAVVFDDSLGIAADLDAAMAAHVDDVRGRVGATLDDPEKLRRFASFVNAPETSPTRRWPTSPSAGSAARPPRTRRHRGPC